MFDFLVTYVPMMRWTQDATQSVVPNGWDTVGNYDYGMMGRNLSFSNMMRLGGGWSFWLMSAMCLVTWILANMVLIALFRWLWKKGSK